MKKVRKAWILNGGTLHGDTLAKDFLALSEEVTLALDNTISLSDVNWLGSTDSEGFASPQEAGKDNGVEDVSKSCTKDSLSSLYCSTLSSLQFDSVDFGTHSEAMKPCHSFQVELIFARLTRP